LLWHKISTAKNYIPATEYIHILTICLTAGKLFFLFSHNCFFCNASPAISPAFLAEINIFTGSGGENETCAGKNMQQI
jgi:hypothetical protein